MSDKIIRLKATVSYEGSTQEAVLDITPYVVKNAYFATKKEQIEYEIIKGGQSSHTVVSKENLSVIAKKYNTTVSKIKKDNGLKNDAIKLKQVLKIKGADTKKEKGKKVTFTPLTKASVGDAVYLVVETKGLQGRTIKINVRQGKAKVIGEKDKALSLTQKDKSITLIKACVGELADYKDHLNKEYLENLAVAPVNLVPKEDKDIKDWNTKIKATKDKKTYLYLLIEADVKGKVKYYGKNRDGSDDHEQRFRDIDGKWLELKICECCQYKIKDNLLQGSNVVHTKTESKVKAQGDLKPVKAIVLHRTVGSTTSSAITHSKGTHFYVDGPKGNDGEIFQSMDLNKKSAHIFDTKTRIARLDIKSSNSVGIEVIGIAYKKKGADIYSVYNTKLKNKDSITKGYTDINGITYYWDKLTQKQIKSVVCIVKQLMKTYNLTKSDILTHEGIQKKSAGEGQAVYDAIISKL